MTDLEFIKLMAKEPFAEVSLLLGDKEIAKGKLAWEEDGQYGSFWPKPNAEIRLEPFVGLKFIHPRWIKPVSIIDFRPCNKNFTSDHYHFHLEGWVPRTSEEQCG